MKNNSILFSFSYGKNSYSNLNLYDTKNIMRFSFLESNKYLEHGPSCIGLDLLTIGLIVSFVDKQCFREDSIFDGWSRDIKVCFPVIAFDKWELAKETLETMLSFLSGDNWHIDFVKRELTNDEEIFCNMKSQFINNNSHESKIDMCMFSGGLDSFIGCIDNLTTLPIDRKTIFVNIYGGGAGESSLFSELSSLVCNHFNYNINLFHSFNVSAMSNGKKIIENSTRCRSFMFFTHALALATCFSNVERLIIPENGTISLNVPLTIGRYGSCSTRTTHPFYISNLQKILSILDLNVQIINPYQFNTKGEMVSQCQDRIFLDENIAKTMSCSHTKSGRFIKGESGKSMNCGTCWPCLIRKSSEYHSYGKLVTNYRYMSGDGKKRSKELLSTERCFALSIEFNDDSIILLKNVIKNGPLSQNIDKYIDVYQRSLEEIKDYLSKCKKKDE